MTKIALVDDHEMFRHSLKFMIEINKVGKVIIDVGNGEEFLKALDQQTPDLVLMDIDMPVMNGIIATQKALEKHASLAVLGLSMHGDEPFFSKMLNVGAKGFLLKNSGMDELFEGIKTVANGDPFFSNALLRNMMVKVTSNIKNVNNVATKITDREFEILQLIANGLSTQEIAEKSFLSPNTVNNYRSSLMSKTKTKNSVDLVMYALKNGLISI